MSFTATHRASVLVLASGQIPQIVNWRHNFGITRAAIAGSGALSDATSGVVQQAPTATLSTTAIVSALTALGSIVSPYSIAAAATLYLRKTVHGGTFASGSTHSKLAGSLGIAVPRTLRLSQTQFATLDMELMWVSSDGATAPIAFTQSVALPTLTMASEKYVLGPIYLNDALTEGIDSVEIDFGMRAKSIFHNGFVYPTACAVDRVQPAVRIQTMDPGVIATLTTGGFGTSASPTRFFARKVADSGLRVADATTQHAKFTITTLGHFIPVEVGGDEGSEASIAYEAHPLDDGTNAILAASTAAAIA
jgi:hypothetical protein